MDDSDDTAETDPLVPCHPPNPPGGAPGRVGGAEDEGEQSAGGPGSVRPIPRPHKDTPKPRLSLVPESSERSSEEECPPAPHLCPLMAPRTPSDASPTPLCPFFGVKNYLHQFYERQDISNPALYEDLAPGEQVFLVKQESGCPSGIFRLSLVLGGLLLLLGAVAFIVAACAARRTILVGQAGDVAIVDHVASSHNAQIDALLLVGLVAVTLGSTVVAAALISRTFCTRPEDHQPFPFRHPHYVLEAPPLSPTDKKVPVTERLTQVQPTPWLLPAHASVKGLMPLP